MTRGTQGVRTVRGVVVGIVAVAVAVVSGGGVAAAFDLTGTWSGTAKCTSLFDGITFKFTDEATVQITQSGRGFGFRADYGPNNVNLYAGRTYDDAKKPDEKGEVALVACGTDSVAGNDPAFDELGRFTAKTKPGKVKATLKGVTYFSDPGEETPEAGTCKWSLTRVDATDPAGATACER
jgi:hypothetical protein